MRIKRGVSFQAFSGSPEATRDIGGALGRILENGDTVYLYGEIGAGKTVFVSGMASALGIEGYITSPTFTIANTYIGNKVLHHFDAFRIESPDELYETGFFDYTGGDCIIAVEWAERLGQYSPERCVTVFIDADGGCDTNRLIRIEFAGISA